MSVLYPSDEIVKQKEHQDQAYWHVTQELAVISARADHCREPLHAARQQSSCTKEIWVLKKKEEKKVVLNYHTAYLNTWFWLVNTTACYFCINPFRVIQDHSTVLNLPVGVYVMIITSLLYTIPYGVSSNIWQLYGINPPSTTFPKMSEKTGTNGNTVCWAKSTYSMLQWLRVNT